LKNKLCITHAYVHWLADPDKSGQAMHSAGFAPANGTFRATDTAKRP